MPDIGHREIVLAFTLDAEAKGGLFPTSDSDRKEYEPPEGYILISHEEIELVNRGDATASTGTAPAGYRIISTDEIQGALETRVEWRYTKVWGKGTLDSSWNNIRNRVEEYQQLRRRIFGNASARGELSGAGAHIRIRVEAIIEYVGSSNDSWQYVNRLLASSSLPNIYYFKPQWNGSGNNVRLEYKQLSNQDWNYELHTYNVSPSVKPHFIYFGLVGKKAGLYKFMPALRTEGEAREVVIAIREEPVGSDDAVGINNKTITLTNQSAAFEVSYTKKRDDTDLYVIVEWNDERLDKIILDGNYTFNEEPIPHR